MRSIADNASADKTGKDGKKFTALKLFLQLLFGLFFAQPAQDRQRERNGQQKGEKVSHGLRQLHAQKAEGTLQQPHRRDEEQALARHGQNRGAAGNAHGLAASCWPGR